MCCLFSPDDHCVQSARHGSRLADRGKRQPERESSCHLLGTVKLKVKEEECTSRMHPSSGTSNADFLIRDHCSLQGRHSIANMGIVGKKWEYCYSDVWERTDGTQD